MPKISVIIPVYNTGKYLDKCLETILNQTYKDYEVIIVNDGSTDNSEEIIKQYESKYNEKIIYKKKINGGLSDARNYGMKYATGDYICFVDSDDYLDIKLFGNLESYINEGYDLIKYKLIKVDSNYKEIERVEGPLFENKTGEEAFNILYSSDVMLQPAWLYLYKKTLLDDNKFEYPIEKYHEDFARTSLIMLKASRVISTDVYGYYYYQSDSSITRGNDSEKKEKRAWDMLEHYDYMMNSLDGYNINEETKNNLKKYYTNNILLKVEEVPKKLKKEYIREINKRNMIKNIKIRSLKQLVKRIILYINIDWYLKLRK